MNEVKTPIRTLLGAKGFETSLVCLRSLVEYSTKPVRLIVHEDGSLAEEHREKLREISPEAELVSRVEADERVLGALGRYPRCLAFRQSEVMALKLFDIMLLSTGVVRYCDSDFLFLRTYDGLFELTGGGRPVFMTDIGHAYAVRPWRLWPLGKLRLVGRLNAGLTVAPNGYLDLDFLEWLLGFLSSDPVFIRRRYWTEQTCWAAMAARSGAGLLDPRGVVMATRDMEGYRKETVAIHFVGTYRDRLPEYAVKQQSKAEAGVKVEVCPGHVVSGLGMLWTDIKRRLKPVR